MHIWDAATGELRAMLPMSGTSKQALAALAPGQRRLAVTNGRTLVLWDLTL
jgi:hypothetical protein